MDVMDYLKTIRGKVIKGAETEDQRPSKHDIKHSCPIKPRNAYSSGLVESGILIESQATHKIKKPRQIAGAFFVVSKHGAGHYSVFRSLRALRRVGWWRRW
jgi:hypothetical protein